MSTFCVARAAAALRAKALERFHLFTELASECVPEEAAALRRIAWMDARDLRGLATMIEEGRIDAVEQRLMELDTDPREEAFEALHSVGALQP